MKNYMGIFLFSCFITGCCDKNESAGTAINEGDKVWVIYTGTLDDGSIFDASSKHGNKPLELFAGKPGTIEGFSKGVIGMKVGEKKKLHIPVDKAYGPVRTELVQEVPKTEFPPNVPLSAGLEVSKRLPNGQIITGVIKAVSEATVTVDLNHPLAGKDLNFEIQVLKVEPAAK